MVVPPAQGYFCRCESSLKIPGRTLLPPHDGLGIREEHLEEGNHPHRGARRRACSHLRRIRRRQPLPDHVVQPDQGRRRLGRRSLARRAQRAAGPEGQHRRCRPAGAAGAQGPKGDTGAPARRARRATPAQPALRVRRARPASAGTRFAPGATRRTTPTRTRVRGTPASAAARSPRSPAPPARSRWAAATGSRRPVTTGSTRRPSRTEAASSPPSLVAWTGTRIRSSRTTTPAGSCRSTARWTPQT